MGQNDGELTVVEELHCAVFSDRGFDRVAAPQLREHGLREVPIVQAIALHPLRREGEGKAMPRLGFGAIAMADKAANLDHACVGLHLSR